MADQASLYADKVTDWRTSIYWRGKAKAFSGLIEANAEMICQFRDRAQEEAFKERSAENDSYEYQFLEGVAAAARETLTLHYLPDLQNLGSV